MLAPLSLAQTAQRCPESPIAYFMRQALDNPKLISLAAGMVDSASLPAGPIGQAIDELFSQPETAQAALQYGTTNGLASLRTRIVEHLNTLDGLASSPATPEHVFITTGSQQLLYMLGEIMLDPGDIVITEAPSYFVYHSLLASRGVRVETVPMDEKGLIPEELERLLARLDAAGELSKVKLLYTVDYYQNPTGLTLSRERRKQVYDIAVKRADRHRFLILEDAAYRELRYEGEEIPSIKSFDITNEFVVYAGTFSKPCAPGLKTGYALLPGELIEPLTRIKGNHDFGSGNLAQYILDRLLANGSYHEHVETLRGVYRDKRDAMLETLRECFSDEPDVEWTHPAGGMFIWLKLPEHVQTGSGSALLQAALEKGVLYIPGEFGHIDHGNGKPRHEIRLSFGSTDEPRIREGIRRLYDAYHQVTVRANHRAMNHATPTPEPARA